jgi:hypothetical protein
MDIDIISMPAIMSPKPGYEGQFPQSAETEMLLESVLNARTNPSIAIQECQQLFCDLVGIHSMENAPWKDEGHLDGKDTNRSEREKIAADVMITVADKAATMKRPTMIRESAAKRFRGLMKIMLRERKRKPATSHPAESRST